MSKTLKIGIFVMVLFSLGLFVSSFVSDPSEVKVFGLVTADDDRPPTGEDDPDLISAVKSTLETAEGRWAAFTYEIDHVQVQDDGQIAIVWLAPVDPETGDWLGREPELALAKLGLDGKWQVLLEGDETFTETFKGFQFAEKSIEGDLLAPDQTMPKSGMVLGGYYLPWAANLEKRLTWSVGHTSCYPIYYCTHAFDFADGTMFPVVAAKGGTVFHWKDTCANGDSSCTNSITLQDRSTTPWTYQIYLHIAQGSVPDKLKQVGTPVRQGQYIADVDDTGYSTAHHLHFMVVTETTRYFSYSMESVWGVAEDITFRDVDINWDATTQGGRPRLAYEAATYGGEGRTYYLSGNKPANPPTGALKTPLTKTYVTTPEISVSGWGRDDVGVTKYEILAKYGEDWVTIKEIPTNLTDFSSDVDLCEAGVPDGPFQLALRVWDYEGNPSSVVTIRKLIKNVECGKSGSEPKVNLIHNEGVLALPQSGFVSARVTPVSSKLPIKSVEFWFNGRDWDKGKWIYLGKDTNGSNGWQAHISTVEYKEGRKYTIVAVATDSGGNQGASVSFKAIVDHTAPVITIDPINSPFTGALVTFNWAGSDEFSGMHYYDLGVVQNNGDFKVLKRFVPWSTTSYKLPVSPAELLTFEVVGYDKSGNKSASRVSFYTEGYVFPFEYVFPVFYNE